MALIVFDFDEVLEEAEEFFQNIHLKDLEIQAQYAQPEFKRVIRHPERCKEITKTLKNRSFKQWTTTDIGNIAYLALKSPVKRRVFKKVLEEYKEFRIWHPYFKEPEPSDSLTWSKTLCILLDMVKVATQTDRLKI